jgi:hypothetical protein
MFKELGNVDPSKMFPMGKEDVVEPADTDRIAPSEEAKNAEYGFEQDPANEPEPTSEEIK